MIPSAMIALFGTITAQLPPSVQKGLIHRPPENLPLPSGHIYTFIGDLIRIALATLGIFGLLALLVSGGMMIFGQGNEDLIKKARGILYFALLGLTIAGAAYAIIFGIIGFEVQNLPEDIPIAP